VGSGPDGVEDQALAEEIVLLGELMAAAAGQAEHLSDARVDELLGLSRPRAADEGEQRAQAAPGEQGPPDEGAPAS
jgi:hypothetical protein